MRDDPNIVADIYYATDLYDEVLKNRDGFVSV